MFWKPFEVGETIVSEVYEEYKKYIPFPSITVCPVDEDTGERFEIQTLTEGYDTMRKDKVITHYIRVSYF